MMIKKILVLSVSLALSTLSTASYAEGNISAGKLKAASCTGCHGEDGNSMVETFPKLAEQHAGYIEQQLQAFKQGSRNAPMMAPLAMGLDKKDIKDIAAYYASKKISKNLPPVLFSDDDDDEDTEITAEQKKAELDDLIALGADIYRNGNLTTDVSACIACHGPVGEGNKPALFPSLRGQHASYLMKALTDFKKGSRSNTPDNIMRMIAKKMDDNEIKALSYYISTMK